jgi:hypothetical protein
MNFREASALMRQTVLPQAQGLFESARRRLGGAQRDAAGTASISSIGPRSGVS